MLIIRSLLFNVAFYVMTPVFSLLVILCRPLGFAPSWFWAKLWSQTALFLLRLICRVKIVIQGREHLPHKACVVMAKHQSALETIAMPMLVPPYVWVLKRELFYIPIFGWALWAIDAIAIRRSNPREALKQVIGQGVEFLHQGRWVVIFPEGRRQAPGATGNYQASGIMLAQRAKTGILPMAHNAGVCWPKRGFFKYPGTITIRFLPYITASEVADLPRAELLERVKDQIEAATRALGG